MDGVTGSDVYEFNTGSLIIIYVVSCMYACMHFMVRLLIADQLYRPDGDHTLDQQPKVHASCRRLLD